MKNSLAVFSVIAVASLTSTSSADLAQSTFATGNDGWASVTLPYPSAIPPTILASFTPTWHAALGGYISMLDPDGTTTGQTEYWMAPAPYLGAKVAAYGGHLGFDLACTPVGGVFHQEDVILVGGGGVTLVYDLGPAPGGAFQHYEVPLFETGWKVGGLTGPQPSFRTFVTALSNITQIFIRAEFQLGADTEYLDNVNMAGPVSDATSLAPPAFVVRQNVPNPFNPVTQIPIVLDHDTRMRVDILDARGSLVRRLWDGPAGRGEHLLAWDGRDRTQRPAASGIYYCSARAGEARREIKMVLLK